MDLKILEQSFYLFFGLLLLVKSAGYISETLITFANRFKLSEFFVGFVVLSWISSIPEFSIVLNSSTVVPELSVGNLLGAKLVLLSLLTGLSVVKFGNLKFNGRFSEKDMIVGLLIMGLMIFVSIDGSFAIWEGYLLIALYFIYIITLAIKFKVVPNHFHLTHINLHKVKSSDLKPVLIIIKILFGGLGAVLSSSIVVSSSINLGSSLGISQALIGLIVLALGTNLTEITVLLTSDVKSISERKLAFGNIIGSATINSMIFGILILAAGGINLSSKDYVSIVPTLVILSLCIMGFLRFAWSGRQVTKFEGFLLLGFYFSFFVSEVLINFLIGK
ncbi:hypothetical protein D6810_02175 [Candidatus Dojkabacteria bacterium]|uniref:Sodium/calcium exchanger membrane region domain-containing protein n=1 Tax=Candidatus Dojkabacteria bacterium TaxID=2099670 RepID=A0A3M0Z263_9BACT|nr:MAG: hypothetical protein D6810_02175 [Candidatus Dojkabacteria bacterium]